MTQKTQVCIQPARKPHVVLSACWRESSSETGSRPQATEFLTQDVWHGPVNLDLPTSSQAVLVLVVLRDSSPDWPLHRARPPHGPAQS